ncbi:MAG: signal peptidase I [archaeon]
MSLKKIWKFIWHDDSLLSWIVNVVIAFVLVKFVIYPGLGLLLGTSHPVVAVVSNSMEHNGNFDQWYQEKGEWYITFRNYSKDEMKEWKLHNGFNKGDIIVLKSGKNINIGDVVVFKGNSNNPIIHRVVNKWIEDGKTYYQTKGDNNNDSFPQLGENKISQEEIIGKAMFKIPFLGYVKIIFTEIIGGVVK